MVAFEQQRVAVAQRTEEVRRDRADVGQDAEVRLPVAAAQLQRLDRIVRYRERAQLDVADADHVAVAREIRWRCRIFRQ